MPSALVALAGQLIGRIDHDSSRLAGTDSPAQTDRAAWSQARNVGAPVEERGHLSVVVSVYRARQDEAICDRFDLDRVHPARHDCARAAVPHGKFAVAVAG